MNMEATLGHPAVMWKGASVGQKVAEVNGHRAQTERTSDLAASVRTNMVSADHEQFLRTFKANEDITEQGKVGKQLTLFTERAEIVVGRKPEPGVRAPEVQQVKRVKLGLISRDSFCKQTRDGKCFQMPKESRKVSRGQEPALRVFCCGRCAKMIEDEMDGVPNPASSWTSKSAWNGFTIEVAFEHSIDGSSTSTVKSLPDFVHTLQSFVTPDAPAIAISEDMRLMARTRSGARNLKWNPSEEGRIEISLITQGAVLHTVELPTNTRLQTLNFSHDATMLLATIQDSRGNTTLVVWSTITGREVKKMAVGTGSLMACFSQEGDRMFAASVFLQGQKLICNLHVFFWNTSLDLQDTYRTDKVQISQQIEGHDSFVRCGSNPGKKEWTSGNGSVTVFDSGRYEADGEEGSVLYHFASRSVEGGVMLYRKHAVSLDQKRFNTHKAHSCLMRLLTALNSRPSRDPVITTASLSQDGSVFAHVFDSQDVSCEGSFKFHIPSNSTVLVWNLKCGELCHRFEHERPVTCVQVSSDGRILLVGVSGLVAQRKDGVSNRMEQSSLVVYSLVTREVLWEVPLMHEVLDAHLAEKDLVFEVNAQTGGALQPLPAVYAVPIGETSKFPCAGVSDDTQVTELQLIHDMEENLAVVTEDELADTEEIGLNSYRSGTPLGGSPCIRPKPAVLANPSLKPISSKQSWRSATADKQMVGLCVSNDGLRYVAKWEGVGNGGQMMWVSVGDVDWRRGRMVHQVNLQLLEAGVDGQPASPGACCISGDGSIVVCSIKGTCRVIVIHVPLGRGKSKILWEFDADVVPKAVGVVGEQLSVIGDKGLQVTFLVKETIVLSYSLITRVLLSKTHHKCSGRTLGIDGSGELRVSLSQDHRVSVSRFSTGQVVYEVFDSTFQFMGISGAGTRLTLKDAGQHEGDYNGSCPCSMSKATPTKPSVGASERANHSFIQIDIPNFELFGPARETCATWISSGEMASMFSVHKDRLCRWMLFDRVVYVADTAVKELAERSRWVWDKRPQVATHPLEAYPGRWSTVVSELVREKDYESINLILEACPCMWAILVYTKIEDVTDDAPDDVTNFFLQALSNNDRLLVQLLLDGVKATVVEGKGENCPVAQMDWVTTFIIQCLKQSRMLDLVEDFLKELPLIKVDETDMRKHVRSHFRGGRVISTGWGSRDAEGLTGPWGLKDTTEEAEQKMRKFSKLSNEHEHTWVSPSHNVERGYQYVVALPRLCDQDFMELMTAYQASPGLLDNESMRAAIRVLEADLQARFFFIPLSGQFCLFLFCLACFCFFVELCVTPVAADGFSKLSRDEIWTEPKGKVGIILGATSAFLNFIFLLKELQKMANSKPIWTYIKPWNVIPWLSNLVAITNFAVFMADSSLITVRSSAGVAMLLLWGTLFTYMRTIRKLSALVNMLLEIMYDMAMFMVVMCVLVVSFAGALYCLHGQILPETERPAGFVNMDGTSVNSFRWASDSILRSFVMSILGSFSEADLISPLGAGAGTLTTLSYVFFFGLAILVSVVGMNALIAIMGDSYARVSESEHSVRDKEVASVMLDKLRNLGSAKARWQRQRRWVHVLSPSEKGSLLDRDNNSMLEQLKREIRVAEARTGTQLGRLLEIVLEHEESSAETVTVVREIDTAVRAQDPGRKEAKVMNMIKEVRGDQEVVQGQMRDLTSAVRSIERKMDATVEPADLTPLYSLPQDCQNVQINIETLLPEVVNLQRDMNRMATQMQNFEWHMQLRLREESHVLNSVAPPRGYPGQQ